jgi:hypothetical protein
MYFMEFRLQLCEQSSRNDYKRKKALSMKNATNWDKTRQTPISLYRLADEA